MTLNAKPPLISEPVPPAQSRADFSSELLPRSLRDDFPILAQRVHADRPLIFLDSAASSQRPRVVIDTLRRVYECDYANVHRGIHVLSERSTDQYEDARRRVAAFINASESAEVIFTSGTTAAINTVARAWGDAFVGEGDEILLNEMEHHSNLVPWFQLATRTGAKIRHIPLTEDGRLNLAQLPAVLNQRTKIIAVTAVSNTLGTINPIREIAAAANQVGAVTLVDAAQSVPHMATDVLASGVDFLVFSGHKMVGPSGVGVLYGRRELLERMPPFLGGGSMIRDVFRDSFTPADLPAKFEAGTPPIAAAIGLAAAIDYLEGIGLDAIHRHERAVVRYAYQQLSTIEGLRLLGPVPEHRAGLVSFVLERPHAHDVSQELDRDGIAVRAGHHCTQPLHRWLGITASTRASFYLYNTLEEIDALVASVQRVGDKFRPSGRRRRKKPDRS